MECGILGVVGRMSLFVCLSVPLCFGLWVIPREVSVCVCVCACTCIPK
jgi:hypothetical protein